MPATEGVISDQRQVATGRHLGGGAGDRIGCGGTVGVKQAVLIQGYARIDAHDSTGSRHPRVGFERADQPQLLFEGGVTERAVFEFKDQKELRQLTGTVFGFEQLECLPGIGALRQDARVGKGDASFGERYHERQQDHCNRHENPNRVLHDRARGAGPEPAPAE